MHSAKLSQKFPVTGWKTREKVVHFHTVKMGWKKFSLGCGLGLKMKALLTVLSKTRRNLYCVIAIPALLRSKEFYNTDVKFSEMWSQYRRLDDGAIETLQSSLRNSYLLYRNSKRIAPCVFFWQDINISRQDSKTLTWKSNAFADLRRPGQPHSTSGTENHQKRSCRAHPPYILLRPMVGVLNFSSRIWMVVRKTESSENAFS